MSSVILILVAVGTVIGALYVLWRPHWTFVLVVALWAIEQLLQSYIPFLVANAALINYAVGSLALLAVGTRVMRQDRVMSGYGNIVTVLTLLLYVHWTAGLLHAPMPEVANAAFRHAFPYWILYLGLFPLLVRDIFDFRRLLNGLLVLGCILATLVLMNPRSSFVSGRFQLDLGDVKGQFRGNSLALAEFGAMLALVAALIRPASISPMFNALRVTSFLLGFGLAIMSGSRGQVLAAAIAGIAIYPLARKVANPKQFFLGAVGFGLFVFGIYMSFKMFIGEENRARWDTGRLAQDLLGRLGNAWELVGIWMASPQNWLFGLGPSAYAAHTNGREAYVHNVPVEILCEHGLFGFTLFIVIVIMLIKYGRELWTTYRDDLSLRATVAVLIGICVYGLVLSMKQGSMYFPAPFYWWLVLAKIAVHERRMLAIARQEYLIQHPELAALGDTPPPAQPGRYALT